jgi:hypothetical protein
MIQKKICMLGVRGGQGNLVSVREQSVLRKDLTTVGVKVDEAADGGWPRRHADVVGPADRTTIRT